tara:strand:- start:2333 stop:2692 length:360 start_codon:yes stop_codon:yes gene_type:complete
MQLELDQLLQKARALESIQFDQLMAVINEHYDYQPTAFDNGLSDNRVVNLAGQNEGSCKLFAFAKLHQLDAMQTLNLFGEYYHRDVLEDPNGASHANIRAFIRDGWSGIEFSLQPLSSR